MQVLNQQYSHMAPKVHNDKRVRPCFPTPVPQPFHPSVPKHWFIRFLCNLQGISKPHLPFAVLVFNKWRDLSLNLLIGLELLAEGGSEQCMWGKSSHWIYTHDRWLVRRVSKAPLFGLLICNLQIAHLSANAEDVGLIFWLGRSPGEGSGSPL